jgi:hypothetical protein
MMSSVMHGWRMRGFIQSGSMADRASLICHPALQSTPPNRRPDAEQADARHREVDKYWQQQRKRHAESKPSDPKKVRLAAIRLRELQTILRDRYGAQLPDDDAGLDDLELLVGYATLAGKKPEHQVSAWAPWCDAAETERLIWSAATHPVWHTPDELAKRVGLRYSVRKRLSIRTIRCVDANSKEREQLRCGNRNKNKRLKRVAKQEEPMQTEPAPMHLKPKERKVLARIDGAEIAVPELTRRVATLKEFQKLAEPQRQLHKILDHLVALGLIADRSENHPQGGKVRFVRHRQ